MLEGRSTPSGDKHLARVLALTMHGVFAVLLVLGVSWQKKPPEPVTAELWSALPPMPQPKVAPAVEPEVEPEPPKPVPRVKPVPAPRVEPKAEPKPAPKADIAIKQERKAEPKAEPRPEPKKREEDKAALERKAAEAREREQQMKQLLEAEKAAEAKAAAERAARAAAARENQKYINGIHAKVWARIALPPGMQGNPEAEFLVALLPGGELESVTMRKSSGDAAYDAAVERAIRQAQPFVVPTGDEFQRSFRRFPMTFRPQR